MFDQHQKWEQDHYEEMQSRMHPGDNSNYQILLDNQNHFFEQQRQWQEENYQTIHSTMQNHVDNSLSSVRAYIDEQNINVLDKLSTWKSNMEAIIGSLHEDAPAPINSMFIPRQHMVSIFCQYSRMESSNIRLQQQHSYIRTNQGTFKCSC